MIQTRLKWNLKKVQYYYKIPVIHIMRLLLLTIVYITSCFGLNDSFFEDMDNDLSGFKVYRANPKNVNQSNFLAELHNSSEVLFILFKKYWLSKSFSFMTSGLILILWLSLVRKDSLNLILLNMESNGILKSMMFNIL